MKPEEMRDDIPMDVREALAAVISGLPCAPDSVLGQIKSALRPKPRTVRLPAVDLPAPLEEVPKSGEVWTLSPGMPRGVAAFHHSTNDARIAVSGGLAWATHEHAEAWLAHMQSWNRPGADWTPHVPGDPMPCDGEALVDVRYRDGDVSRSDHADHYSWQRLDEDRPHDFDITAWRYAREES